MNVWRERHLGLEFIKANVQTADIFLEICTFIIDVFKEIFPPHNEPHKKIHRL